MDPRFWTLLEKHHLSGILTVGLPASAPSKDEEGEDSEEAKTIKPLKAFGPLPCEVPSATKNPEKWQIPALEAAGVPTMNVAGAKKLVLAADSFSKFVRQIGFAAGDDAGDTKFRNILMRSMDGQKVDLVTINPYGLAKIMGAHKGASSGEFAIVTPYINMASVARLLPNPKKDVDIDYVQSEAGGRGYVVLSQPIVFGANTDGSEKIIGKVMFRIACATEPFRKFEKTLSSLSFKVNVSFKRAEAIGIVDRIPWSKEEHKLVVEIDPAANVISLHKQEKSGLAVDGDIPLTACDIKEKFVVEMDTKAFKDCLGNTGADQVTLRFSGLESLSQFVLDESFDGYFQTFGAPKK